MRRTGFWKSDWFGGLVLSGLILVAANAGARLAPSIAGVVGEAGLAWPGIADPTSAIDAPAWNLPAARAVFALTTLYVAFVLPRLSAGIGTPVSAIMLAVLLGLPLARLLWEVPAVQLLPSVALLLAGYILFHFRRIQGIRRPAAGKSGSGTAPLSRSAPPVQSPVVRAEPPPIIGKMLGRYRIERLLGKGAMGAVYLGREAGSERAVAIKTMALAQEFEASGLADAKARFFREVESAGRLRHPNIVVMYDAGEEGELAYIAMEYLHGRDLAAFTKPENLLPLPRVLSILARVADALSCAHRHNVVHRDVKPANVIYEPLSDIVKVMDFGVARLTDASKTKTGMVLGSPSYMSPEQLLGRKVDGRSDLFSLGVMLYQLACGRLPFVGESMGRLMYKITNEAPPDVRSVNPQVPDDVAGVIGRAMSKNAEQRYQTAEEMARELRACLDRSREVAVEGEAGRQGR